MFKITKLLLAIGLISILALSSCSVKRYSYLKADNSGSLQDTLVSKAPEYVIQYNDLLYLRFYSILEESVEIFNNKVGDVSSSQRIGGAYGNQSVNYEWMSYRVDAEGFIELPVLGKLPVKGLNLKQIKELADKSVAEYVEDAFCEVKLMSFDVEMLGEFNNPGKINTLGYDLNLMEAIDKAGGISYAGNWRKVFIIRQLGDKKFTFHIDVTNRNLLGTEAYYLMPHDVVFVEPRSMSAARVNISDFTLLLSTVTSTLTTVFLIISLNKK